MPTTADLAALLQGPPGDKQAIAAALDEARQRTWSLVAGLPDDCLAKAPCGYLSPPSWDLGHMANFEERWLVQQLVACSEMHEGYNATYDAFQHPRPKRPRLRLLDRAGLRAYHDAVRKRSLEALEACSFDQRLTRDGFVHWMIVLHEHQHQETILQALQMIGRSRYRPPEPRPLQTASNHDDDGAPAWAHVPAGPFSMGMPHGPGTYDNEAPVHVVAVPTFDIARFPVTCGEYLAFMEAGGYDEPRWWSGRGRRWLEETDHHAPLYWHHDGQWWRSTLVDRSPVQEVGNEILCHVTCFEAEAYAAWAGARLPSEAEWEKACRHDPAGEDSALPGDAGSGTPRAATDNGAEGTSRRNPWGDEPATPRLANIDQLGLQPSPAGTYPAGASPCGAQHMVGDVWEWTSSGFQPYPGFEAFPYREYSEVFFGGDHRVLRGGSWASRAGCATGTFRNWDHPYRRQIFSGIRLARDASHACQDGPS